MASDNTTTTTTNNDRFNAEAAAWDSNPDVHRASDGALQALLSTYPSPPPPPSSSSSDPQSHAHIHLTRADPRTDVLEIGCGTGLLSFRLAPYVRSILAVDAAPGMISALEAKLERSTTTTEERHRDPRSVITPLCILLQDAEDPRLPPSSSPASPASPQTTTTTTTTTPRKKFDLVTSHLTLHHVPPSSLVPLLATMYAALRPDGGQVALTDFQDFGPEAEKFHPRGKMAGVEAPRGIDAETFASLLRDVGFVDVDVRPAWVMGGKEVERFPGEWGEDGVKPGDGGGQGKELAKMDFPFLLCRGTKRVSV